MGRIQAIVVGRAPDRLCEGRILGAVGRHAAGGDEISSYRDRSIFLEDASGRFKRLLLAGREWDMVLLAALTYSIIDVFAANTLLPCLGRMRWMWGSGR